MHNWIFMQSSLTPPSLTLNFLNILFSVTDHKKSPSTVHGGLSRQLKFIFSSWISHFFNFSPPSYFISYMSLYVQNVPSLLFQYRISSEAVERKFHVKKYYVGRKIPFSSFTLRLNFSFPLRGLHVSVKPLV